jgi:uncharacterized Zn finger protein
LLFILRGRAPAPIPAQRRRALTTTFWGKAWCDNLERYADFATRLPRGRSYARNGSVVDLVISRGTVEAHVAGSELYRTSVRVARMAPARWKQVVSRCTGKIASLVALLKGELSAEVLAVLADRREGLFPEPREIEFDCSCPDDASMCKHVAAVLYGVGIRLDAEPALFFTLRDVDQAELLSSAAAGAVSRPRSGGGKRIAADKLASVFGIELDDGRRATPRVARKAARSAAPGSRGGRGFTPRPERGAYGGRVSRPPHVTS